MGPDFRADRGRAIARMRVARRRAVASCPGRTRPGSVGGRLAAERVPNQRSVLYQAAGSPTDFLARASQQRVEELVRLLGDAALAAFEVQLGKLSEEQRRRLRDMAGR